MYTFQWFWYINKEKLMQCMFKSTNDDEPRDCSTDLDDNTSIKEKKMDLVYTASSSSSGRRYLSNSNDKNVNLTLRNISVGIIHYWSSNK